MTDYTELKRAAEAAAQGRWNQDGFEVQNGDIKDYRVARCNRLTDAKFIAAASPAAVLALIAENERLRESDQESTELCDTLSALLGQIAVAVRGPEEPKSRHGFHDLPSRVKTVAAERDQLKAENDRIRSDNREMLKFKEHMVELRETHGFDSWAAALVDVDRLRAENEALRDDIEQSQYDVNAWRNSEESVWIEVFNSEGDDPFISAITGQITVEQLALIQAEILEYREDYFEKGSGLYVFKCRHYQANYDNVGMTEPAHWETDFESYSPFPWEEEAAALANGERS